MVLIVLVEEWLYRVIVILLKVELNILNALINSTNFNEDLGKMLTKYPEIVRTFPILIAIHEFCIPIIEDFSSDDIAIKEYNFNLNHVRKLTKTEIQDYISFINKTGVYQLFSLIKDFYDYVLGVEVGLDTNARKNRGGKIMEKLIEPIIVKLSEKYNLIQFSQTAFKVVSASLGIDMPTQLLERRCDFILIKEKKFCNIEVNYYSGSGSKPSEIVDSYILRNKEIEQQGGSFIWITDGNVWITSSNQIRKGFSNLPYILNLSFIRKGLLEEAIKEIFKV